MRSALHLALNDLVSFLVIAALVAVVSLSLGAASVTVPA